MYEEKINTILSGVSLPMEEEQLKNYVYDLVVEIFNDRIINRGRLEMIETLLNYIKHKTRVNLSRQVYQLIQTIFRRIENDG